MIELTKEEKVTNLLKRLDICQDEYTKKSIEYNNRDINDILLEIEEELRSKPSTTP